MKAIPELINAHKSWKGLELLITEMVAFASNFDFIIHVSYTYRMYTLDIVFKNFRNVTKFQMLLISL